MAKFVSRAGEKLEYALEKFGRENGVEVVDKVCADMGANAGGFTDCLLQHGASKVYAVETGYGVLDWKLRNDNRVVVMERTNAMHVALPELMDLIVSDTSWTRLDKVIPNILNNLKSGGQIIALMKPHYEVDTHALIKGKLPDELVAEVLENIRAKLNKFGLTVLNECESPILGGKAKNREFLFLFQQHSLDMIHNLVGSGK